MKDSHQNNEVMRSSEKNNKIRSQRNFTMPGHVTVSASVMEMEMK